jgi:hypothetical protein
MRDVRMREHARGEPPMDWSRTVSVLALAAISLAASLGCVIGEESPQATYEEFSEAVANNATCKGLFDIKNRIPHNSADVQLAVDNLMTIECTSRESTRTMLGAPGEGGNPDFPPGAYRNGYRACGTELASLRVQSGQSDDAALASGFRRANREPQCGAAYTAAAWTPYRALRADSRN